MAPLTSLFEIGNFFHVRPFLFISSWNGVTLLVQTRKSEIRCVGKRGTDRSSLTYTSNDPFDSGGFWVEKRLSDSLFSPKPESLRKSPPRLNHWINISAHGLICNFWECIQGRDFFVTGNPDGDTKETCHKDAMNISLSMR